LHSGREGIMDYGKPGGLRTEAGAMRAELRDALEFLYADSEVSKRPRRRAGLDVARGAVASVHVLVTGLEPGGRLRLEVRRGRSVAAEARWSRLRHVPVERNTGPVGFVEKKGERNRHVIRRAPFRVYDAVEPVGRTVRAGGSTEALRLEIPVPRDARPLARDYTITVSSGREQTELRLAVRVRKPVVPAVGRASLPYTNWFSLGLMASRHGLKPWSDEHWKMIRRYANLMVRGRQNTFWVPLRDVFSRGRRAPVLERERLRRIVRLFTSAGMHWIEGGHVASRTDGVWTATTFDLHLANVRATSIKGNAALAGIARQLVDEIDRNGWRDRWLQHVADEPSDTNADDYRILAGMVRRHMPGLPILDATMNPALAGSVDIWCPQAQRYQQRRRMFEAQKAAGDSVWFYTCCFPGGKWLNRLLDMELLRPALLGWGAALYGLEGFLHWGLNHYRPEQDPLEQSVVDHGNNNFLPAGDTHIVYPGDGRPWSSLRLEAQREGLEDFELLRMLRARRPKAAERVIQMAIRGFDRYTKDVGKFRAARRALLGALER